jgi:hypothetical protein
MKNKILLAIVISFTLALSGCNLHFITSTKKPAASGEVFSAIKNPQKMTHGTLSVYKPGDWQEVKQGMILYYLPPGKTATDTLAEKIIVAAFKVQPFNSTTTLARFMKNDFFESQKNFASLKFISADEAIKLGQLAAREEKYQAQISSATISLTQIDARSGDLLYKLQHYCVQDKCQADGIFSEMAASFAPIAATSTTK